MNFVLSSPFDIVSSGPKTRKFRCSLFNFATSRRKRPSTGVSPIPRTPGDGTATASLLAERHAVRPQGTAGGKDGASGAHVFVKQRGCQSRAVPEAAEDGALSDAGGAPPHPHPPRPR